jgi:two-component system sensor histidine kinase KdpD
VPSVSQLARFSNYGKALLAVFVTIAAVWFLQLFIPVRIVYLVPLTLLASLWGRGPAILAVVLGFVLFDYFFIEPLGTLLPENPGETIALLVLLVAALVTTRLVDAAERGAEAAKEASALRRSEQLKTTLLRTVSHDFRTPLATIKANASSMREPRLAFSTEDRAELLAGIEEESDRLTRLIENLLEASQLEAGAITPEKSPQDVREIIEAVVARIEKYGESPRIDVSIPDDLPLVPCDYVHIDHVLTNLLENAIRHTPPGTPIQVQTSVDRDYVHIAVTDKGPGISQSDAERIFRTFERANNSGRGSGLGLPIARGLVEAHGGHLWLEDVPGGGSRFVFRLPL